MLGLLIATRLVWQPDWPLYRYDALFIAAILIQATFLALKLESFDEAKVILIYHVVGTAMEIFKTHMGSWTYPEPALIRIDGVPLFSGFMYAAVGSYLARVIRIFDMRFTNYPRFVWTVLLCGRDLRELLQPSLPARHALAARSPGRCCSSGACASISPSIACSAGCR